MTTTLTDLVSEFYEAPLNAVQKAEAHYRETLANWLDKKWTWYKALDEASRQTIPFSQFLNEAPAIQMNAVFDLSATLRIASVSSKSASLSGGLALGPIQTSGGFGFSSQRSEESVLKAASSITISNTATDLVRLLGKYGIDPTDESSVKTAVALLRGGTAAESDQNAEES